MAALVTVISVCLIIPTIASIANGDGRLQQHGTMMEDQNDDILILSRATAVVLLVLCLSYLTFRFHTHERFFTHGPARASTFPAAHTAALRAGDAPNLFSLPMIFLTAVVCTIVCANYVIRSTEDTIKTLHVTKSFLGLMVLPLAGNLAKSVQIIMHSRDERDGRLNESSKLDLAIRSVMTNVLDNILFILPLLVLLGWIIGQPMALRFGFFESVIFLLAIVIMTYLIQHGKTTYFQGFMLMGT
jgi:Ca2+:H+ antiporter